MFQQDAAIDTLDLKSRGTLGDVIEDSEATLFVGRTPELAQLEAAVSAAQARSVAIYLHGPAGVGKSALLKVFARSLRARNVPVLMLDRLGTNRTAEYVDRAIAVELGIPADGYGLSPAIAATINERALPNGFVVIVDHYDDLVEADYWLRGQIFRQLGRGVCLILAGRMRAAQLWSRDLGWTRALTELPLQDLGEEDVGEFLRRCGLSDPVVAAEAYAITGGRPQLLGLAANALLLQPEAAVNGVSRQNSSRLALFLIEHILHPGSRRRSWRAGTGSSEVDTTVATAAVMPSFDRSELAAIVGRAGVEGTWPSLLSLSTATDDGLHYRFPEPLRRQLAEAVAHQRPWAERQWRRSAIRYHLRAAREGRTGSDGSTSWRQIVQLARESAWWDWLNPPCLRDGALQIARGMAADDLPDLSTMVADARVAEHLHDIVDEFKDCFLVARAPAGAIEAAVLAIPATRDTWERLTSWSAVGASGFEWPEGAPESWFGSTVALLVVASRSPEAVGALVGEACCDWRQYDRILAISSAQWGLPGGDTTPLDALGFHRISTDSRADMRVLDLGQMGYANWLATVVRPRLDGGMSSSQWASAAKDALQVLDEPDLLARTAAGQYYAGVSGSRRGGAVRAWMLDALASADLGDAPPSGRVLLTLYYVDRVGPHEVIAERMNLPRTTYFRCHRQALTKLGESLFNLT